MVLEKKYFLSSVLLQYLLNFAGYMNSTGLSNFSNIMVLTICQTKKNRKNMLKLKLSLVFPVDVYMYVVFMLRSTGRFSYCLSFLFLSTPSRKTTQTYIHFNISVVTSAVPEYVRNAYKSLLNGSRKTVQCNLTGQWFFLNQEQWGLIQGCH